MRRTSFQRVSTAGLVIDRIALEADRMFITAHPSAADAGCPDFGLVSTRIHSRYERRLLDLPSHGHAVHLRVQVRRFRYGNVVCPRQIFGEPLAENVAPRGARRLMLPVSRGTLLRVVRRRAMPTKTDVRVLGIDNFAWKRGQRYGTLLCDLEQRGIIDLLPDRETATVEIWLAAHPGITVVSRDRGAGYGHAASRAASQAMQVADRWHLPHDMCGHMVVLDGKKVVSATVNHGLCNGLLAEDRITGNNPVAQMKPGE